MVGESHLDAELARDCEAAARRPLRELGFPVDGRLEADLVAGKGFVQIRSDPFDLNLVFAPDGIESFEAALGRSELIEGKFPVASLDDIIRSKRAANRQRDREVLARLEALAVYRQRRPG